ncbi:hypothetical protein D3C71_2014670 [compost metagenome]
MVELSAWLKAWNSRSFCSASMPMPVSRMEKVRTARSSVTSTARTDTTTSPASVNLMALPARLVSTC